MITEPIAIQAGVTEDGQVALIAQTEEGTSYLIFDPAVGEALAEDLRRAAVKARDVTRSN